MTDRAILEALTSQAAQRIARELQASLPPGVGFAVLLFDIGAKGNLAYVSNAERKSMIEALREFIDHAENGRIRSALQGPRS